MMMVSYKRTMAGAKQFVPNQPEKINPRYLKGRARLIAMSREYERQQAERKAAEEARRERIRAQEVGPRRYRGDA